MIGESFHRVQERRAPDDEDRFSRIFFAGSPTRIETASYANPPPMMVKPKINNGSLNSLKSIAVSRKPARKFCPYFFIPTCSR
jgi:hypothetical protein